MSKHLNKLEDELSLLIGSSYLRLLEHKLLTMLEMPALQMPALDMLALEMLGHLGGLSLCWAEGRMRLVV